MPCLAVLVLSLTVLAVSTNQFTYVKCKISLSYAKVAFVVACSGPFSCYAIIQRIHTQLNFYLIYVAGQFKVFRYFRFTSATRPMSLRITPSTLTHGYTHKCSSMRKWHSYWINRCRLHT